MTLLRSSFRPLIALFTAIALLSGGALALAPAAQAADNASITGTVTGPGGATLVDVEVVAYRYDAGFAKFLYEGSDFVEGSTSYSITGLRAGSFKVGFRTQGYVETFNGGATSLEAATPFTLAESEHRANVNATLTVGATVSGKITLDGGATEAGIWVEVVRLDGSTVHGDDTNALGNYSIGGIAPGTYTLSFSDDESDTVFPFQYLGGTIVVGDATTFTVGAEGTTAVVNGAISPEPVGGATIGGHVTGAGGLPVDEVYVIAWHKEGGEWTEANGALTDAAGDYAIKQLLPGEYRISFWSEGYANQTYTDSYFVEAGTSVTVAADATRDDIDVDLAAGASVAGKVTKVGGAAESETQITVYAVDGATRRAAGGAFTKPDGTYSIKGLTAGTYTLGFSGGASNVPEQYLGGGGDLETATTFTVGAVEARTGLNMTVTAGSTVSGTVRTPAGAAAGGVYVVIYKRVGTGPAATWEWFYDDDTATNGTYSFDGLAAGTYTLKFSTDDEFPTQYFGGVSTIESATTFTVTTGQNRTVDYTLRTDATIDVPPIVTSTSLVLSAATRAYGLASSATVQVAGIGATGTVVIKDGTKTIGSGSLVAGKATIALPKTLAVTKHNLAAVYAGTATHLGSTSATKVLNVVKATPTVTAKLAKKTISKKSKGKVTVTVKATALVPTGTVKIMDGKKVLKTVTLKNGSVVVTLPKLKKGKHKISVAYSGSSTVAAKKSAVVTLTVKKK